MNSDKFKEKIKSEVRNTIAIDFDGVIHRNSKGFYDGTIYDKPVKGTKKSLKKLYDLGFNLLVFTCKVRKDRPLINEKTGLELIWEWLEKWEFDKYISKVTNEKPRALYYIDDKGIRFEDWNQTLEFIEEENVRNAKNKN